MNVDLYYRKELLTDQETLELEISGSLTDEEEKRIIEAFAVHPYAALSVHFSGMQMNLSRLLSEWKGQVLTLNISKDQLTDENIDSIAELGILMSFDSEAAERHLTFCREEMTAAIVANNKKLLQSLADEQVEIRSNAQFMLISALADAEKTIAQMTKDYNILQGKYDRLHRRYKSYGVQQAQNNQAKLQEKYRDTLHRLNNLRESKLGKLQIKYWDLRK